MKNTKKHKKQPKNDKNDENNEISQNSPKKDEYLEEESENSENSNENEESDESSSSGDEEVALELSFDKEGRIEGWNGELNFNFRSFRNTLSIQSSNGDLDRNHYEKLIGDCEIAFTARSTDGSKYSDGDTFWISANDQPRCDLESFAQSIFFFHSVCFSFFFLLFLFILFI